MAQTQTQAPCDSQWQLFRRYLAMESERLAIGDQSHEPMLHDPMPRLREIDADQSRIRTALGAALFERLAAEWL